VPHLAIEHDVLGAQQAFTDTLSSIVSNLITVVLTVAVMAFLSWQITVVACCSFRCSSSRRAGSAASCRS